MKVLITGTSSGIGYGLAHEYIQRGAEVWGVSRREVPALNESSNYHHLQLDLTDEESIHKLLPAFLKSVDNFDLVILNAGILGDIKLMEDTPVDEMKTVMEVNVWANKNLLDLLFSMPVEIKQVVGMSSKAALRSNPGWGSYSLSKAALDMLINIYAKENSETHFSALAPGLVDSEIQDKIYNVTDLEKYPSAKHLQEARYTDLMPDAIKASPMLIKGIEKALAFESGSHVDVREMSS